MGLVEKMKFIPWLLKRINRHLFNNWEWIEKYREFIIDQKGLSIVLTLFGGLAWFIISALFVIWLVDDKQLGTEIMQGVILSVPLFYVYNWVAALYQIYDNERMATWERLKE